MVAHIYFDVKHSFPVAHGSARKRELIAEQARDKVVDMFQSRHYLFLAGVKPVELQVDFFHSEGFSRIYVAMKHPDEGTAAGKYLKWNELQAYWEELIQVVKKLIRDPWISTSVKVTFRDKYSQSIGIVAYNSGFWSSLAHYLKLRAGFPTISTVAVGVYLYWQGHKLSNDITFAVFPFLLTVLLTTIEVLFHWARPSLSGKSGIHYHVEK